MFVSLQRSVDLTMSGDGVSGDSFGAGLYAIGAIPEIYEMIEGVYFDKLPAIDDMMTAANSSIEFSKKVSAISNDVALDLSSLSLNYTENFAILAKFRYNYTFLFDAMSYRAKTAFNDLDLKLKCFKTMQELMTKNANIGKRVVFEV